MEAVEFMSLPRIQFAHIYSSPTYNNSFNQSKGTMEIGYISHGEILRKEGEKTFIYQKGDVMCTVCDGTTFVNASAFHEHHTVNFQVDWCFIPNQTRGLLLPAITRAELHTQKACGIIDTLIRRKHQYMESPMQGAAKVLELVCEIDRCNRSNKADIPGELLYTQRAKEFINENIQHPITQRSVAEHLSITPEYLCAVFKKAEGVPLMKYINSIKLQAIASLMQRENIHLYEASALYGYADPNYVSRLYKQYFGHNITDKSATFH